MGRNVPCTQLSIEPQSGYVTEAWELILSRCLQRGQRPKGGNWNDWTFHKGLMEPRPLGWLSNKRNTEILFVQRNFKAPYKLPGKVRGKNSSANLAFLQSHTGDSTRDGSLVLQKKTEGRSGEQMFYCCECLFLHMVLACWSWAWPTQAKEGQPINS